MRWIHEAYRDNLGRFGRRDGIKALAAYGLIMGSCFFQGWLYTTDLSASLLNFSQLWISLLVLAVCLVYMVASKEGWGSIGITTGNAKGSIPWLASAVNALFFLSIHYPVRWIVSGTVSLGSLSGVYVVLLLILHGLCDGVYKRTNCLWGSIVLHIIYNAVGAMVVFQ